MSRSLLYVLGTSFLTLTLGGGCSHLWQRDGTNCGQEPLPASVLLQPLTEPEVPVVIPGTAPVALPPGASPPFAAVHGDQRSEGRGQCPPAAAVVASTFALEPPPPVLAPIPIKAPPEGDQKVKQVSWLGDRVCAHRDCTDTTTHPAFAHDKDHRWLVGLLGKGRDGRLILRYASVDEDDSMNGHVLLSSYRPLKGFHPGQLVRVEGQVVSPPNGAVWATYRVESMQLCQER